MNMFRLTAFYALLVLASCGSNEQKNGSDTTAAGTTAVDTMNTMPASTIVTTPQNIMVATHKVADFAKWKASYDAHDSLRLANGVHNYVIGRGLYDTSTVLVAVKVDDMDKAKAFGKSATLKDAMKKGGVIGTPDINYHTLVYQDTAMIGTDIRSRTTFTVKDFDAWKTAFESNRQTRADNGITERVYGYDPDDNHKVTLVVAINDTAKAQAFWKSDLLKQQRAASGLASEPKRFLFRVVQRY